RVIVLDGGELAKILALSHAVVTVNSTVGAQALGDHLPVIALGSAVYDIPGLTYQGDLDHFWTEAAPPGAKVFEVFRRVLVARCVLPGSFFSEAGLRSAVAGAVERLEAAYARPARGAAEDRLIVEPSPPAPMAAA